MNSSAFFQSNYVSIDPTARSIQADRVVGQRKGLARRYQKKIRVINDLQFCMPLTSLFSHFLKRFVDSSYKYPVRELEKR